MELWPESYVAQELSLLLIVYTNARKDKGVKMNEVKKKYRNKFQLNLSKDNGA